MLIILFLSFSFVFGIKDMKGLTREWDQFKMDFNKTYESDIEEHSRFEIFANTYNKIRTHNAKYEAGRVSYKLGINQFSDLTTLELNRKMNAYQRSYKSRHGTLYKSTLSSNKSLPDSIDWRSKGAVTPVKDQNHCGCCWAFSATGAIEGHNFLKTGKLISLSEQNLVDCAKNGGNEGCNGGYMNEAFTYVIQNKGIDTEESYPYEAKDNDCRFNEKTIGATLTDFVRLPSGNEEILKEVVATIGPVATAIDTSDEHYRSFKSGVFNIDKCSSERLTHGVLIVGYGTEDGNDYWLVKNSYGKSWGLDGYIKMARNKQNHCGIATDASYPVV